MILGSGSVPSKVTSFLAERYYDLGEVCSDNSGKIACYSEAVELGYEKASIKLSKLCRGEDKYKNNKEINKKIIKYLVKATHCAQR